MTRVRFSVGDVFLFYTNTYILFLIWLKVYNYKKCHHNIIVTVLIYQNTIKIIITKNIVTVMQANNKQQIIKLLGLDSMITEYLQEPKLNRKTPACNYKQKSVRIQQSAQKLQTMEASYNKRAYSSHNITRKTIQGPQVLYRREQSPIRNKFNKINRSNTMKDSYSYKNQGKDIQHAKIFRSKTKITQPDEVKLSSSIKKQNQKTINDSTHKNIDESIQVNSIYKVPISSLTNKQKIKFRVPKCYLDFKNQKSQPILKSRYQLQKVIGRGLSGLVYRAKDILSERYVAIKIIDLNNIQYQFIKELQHPNMICYYNSFIQSKKRYIVLEYLPYTLSQIVKKKRLSQNQVKKIFRSISSGLMYLHSLSYAHRDIKLDNIVTNEDFSIVKFIDFGLCVDTSQVDIKQKKRFCGTTSYMAPQVISSKCLQPKKADIWSLGVALYILAVGRTPFSGRQEMQIFNKIKNNRTLFPIQMDSRLKCLLSDMLSKNPEDRPSIFDVVNHRWLNQ